MEDPHRRQVLSKIERGVLLVSFRRQPTSLRQAVMSTSHRINVPANVTAVVQVVVIEIGLSCPFMTANCSLRRHGIDV